MKKLLFLTPCVPARSGSGLAQRAFYTLKALAQTYEVYLLVIGIGVKDRKLRDRACPAGPVAAEVRIDPRRNPTSLARMALQTVAPRVFDRAYALPSEWRCASRRLVVAASRKFAFVPFDVIHVFRLYMDPFAAPYRRANPNARTQLDLDEVESATRRRFAALHEANQEPYAARQWLTDARAYQRVEAELLPRYDDIFVASAVEKKRVESQNPGLQTRVLPNVVEAPPRTPSGRESEGQFVFLFVGNLAYYPNQDAVTFFSRDVLPRVRCDAGVRFDIIGGGVSRTIRRSWERTSGLRYLGPVDRLEDDYQRAGAVVVPLRAGGGTRIKILEAFAHRIPVVATSIGAEGIDAVHNEHLLLADGPAELAAACLELIRDRRLGLRLAANAFELHQSRYQPAALRDVLIAERSRLDPSFL